MKCADRSAGKLRQFDGAHLGSVNGPARAIRGEDGSLAIFNDGLEAKQARTCGARTGAAHGIEAEHTQDARDEFAIEAAADKNHGIRSAEVERAGKNSDK